MYVIDVGVSEVVAFAAQLGSCSDTSFVYVIDVGVSEVVAFAAHVDDLAVRRRLAGFAGLSIVEGFNRVDET